MNLPVSVAALGEQLGRGDEIVPDPALFDSAETFAAEREAVFAQPWDAVDHASRFDHDEAFFRCDTAGRSLLVTRDAAGGLHALRNLCLHAGYPICEAEEGTGTRLTCPYHGWEYTLDGRLVEPNLSARIDPARLQVPKHTVHLQHGLILVGKRADSAGSAEPPCAARLPGWLAAAAVTGRSRCNTSLNWKLVLQLVERSPQLFVGNAGLAQHRFGPLSLMFAGEERASLVRIIPKFAGQTDLQQIELAAPGTAPRPAAPDGAAAVFARADAAALSATLDRDFYGWYWSLMAP